MTKQDFELIASHIRESWIDNEGPSAAPHKQWRGVESVAYRLASALERTNPRFDRARFLRACGVEG